MEGGIVAGTHQSEQYGLPMNQQSGDEEIQETITRQVFKVTIQHLHEPSWNSANDEDRCERDAHRAQLQFGYTSFVICALRRRK